MYTRINGMLRASFLTLLSALGLAFAASAFTASSAAAASCVSSSGCYPGSGYTAHYSFNCGGLPANIICWQPGRTGDVGSGDAHTFGWASADHDGGGSTTVGVCLSTSGNYCAHNGEGTNLVRVCIYSGCNDDSDNVWRTAAIYTRTSHTIYGNAKA